MTPLGHCMRRARWTLSGAEGSAASARRHTRAFLRRCDSEDPSGERERDVLLVVGELVSNAVRHAPGPCVLELSETGGNVTVGVADTSRAVPQPRTPDLRGAGGFGWHLVTRLARSLDVQVKSNGKAVIAVLA